MLQRTGNSSFVLALHVVSML